MSAAAEAARLAWISMDEAGPPQRTEAWAPLDEQFPDTLIPELLRRTTIHVASHHPIIFIMSNRPSSNFNGLAETTPKMRIMAARNTTSSGPTSLRGLLGSPSLASDGRAG